MFNKSVKWWRSEYSIIRLGITIKQVIIKNVDQSFKKSTNSPLKDASVVRPKLPSDASKAYWVAEKAWPVRTVRKDTKATVENAVVKLSTMMVAKKRCSFGPIDAIQANIKLLADIVTPPIISPRTIPNLTLTILPIKVNKVVKPHPISLE